MSGGPDATGSIRQGPRAGPRQPDELFECRRAHAGGRRDQHRRRAEERDWREIADEVDGCLTTERTPAGVAAVDQYQGVPVGRRAGRQLQAESAGRAGPVLNRKRLFQGRAQPCGEDSRERVRSAARRVGNDDPRRSRWIPRSLATRVHSERNCCECENDDAKRLKPDARSSSSTSATRGLIGPLTRASPLEMAPVGTPPWADDGANARKGSSVGKSSLTVLFSLLSGASVNIHMTCTARSEYPQRLVADPTLTAPHQR